MPGTEPTLTKKAFGQHKADGYDLPVWSRSAGAPRPCCKSAGRDPYQTGERQNQAAKQVWQPVARMHRQDNETPALNALKALRGAPISMGRGEIPVELLAGSHPFFASLIFK